MKPLSGILRRVAVASAAVLLVFLAGSLPAAHADTLDFNFTLLGYPGYTGMRGINNNGEAVGFAGTGPELKLLGAAGILGGGLDNPSTGFLDVDGTLSPITAPGASNTYPEAINDGGQIVGYDWNGTTLEGFLDINGVFSAISVPGASGTVVYGINDSGQIVGAYVPAGASGFQGFVDTNGVFTTFPYGLLPNGIANDGEIVGMSLSGPFLDTDGTFTAEFPDGPDLDGEATASNDNGQIVGIYDNGTNYESYLDTGGILTGFAVPGAQVTLAYGINDNGQIVGDSSLGAFIATPVPEPPTWTLLALGLCCLAAWAALRQKRARLQ